MTLKLSYKVIVPEDVQTLDVLAPDKLFEILVRATYQSTTSIILTPENHAVVRAISLSHDGLSDILNRLEDNQTLKIWKVY